MSERKRTYTSKTRPHVVGVRLSDAERALLEAAAEHEGTTPASLLRDTFLAEYGPSAAGVTRRPG